MLLMVVTHAGFASSNVSNQARVAYRKLLNGVTAWQFDFSLVVIFDRSIFWPTSDPSFHMNQPASP